jgi:hypothetical protein
MRYWNMARQRYCCGLVRCWWAPAGLCRPRRERSPAHPRGKPGFLTRKDKVPRETDSLLEGEGFEPSVPLGIRRHQRTDHLIAENGAAMIREDARGALASSRFAHSEGGPLVYRAERKTGVDERGVHKLRELPVR